MSRCPLCETRSAKRYCPAKLEQICPVCCGTKREVEIDCPSACAYLRSGRNYEAEKRTPDPDLMAKADRFDNEFLYRFAPVIDTICRELIAERKQSPWLVDNDVIEVYKALTATLKTLAGGIYYETLPDGPTRQSLFRRIKSLLDNMMQPPETIDGTALKMSEAMDVVDFLSFAAQANSSIRPKSRKYLDWLVAMSPADETLETTSSGLILP